MSEIEENQSATCFLLPKHSENKIYRSYDEFATKAFYDTFRDICDLENGRKLHEGQYTVSSIAFWCLALESLLNVHLTICCTKFNLNLKKYTSQSITQRLLALLTILDIDKNRFNENEVIGKLHELMQFRNLLFEERYEEKVLIFRKTCFSNYPLKCTIYDSFQTMLIVSEIAKRLSRVFPGVDTMPEILLSNGGSEVVQRFDECYKHILHPCLQEALEKHGLDSPLDMYHEEYSFAYSNKFHRGEVKMIRSDNSDTETSVKKSFHALQILNDCINEWAEPISVEHQG